MTEPRVWTFFYGSYMNLAVLREVGLAPERLEVARLDGYDIKVAPRANLVPSSRHSVFGVLAQATHRELDRLYQHAQDVLGEMYLPHPVLVQTLSGGSCPALCNIAPSMKPAPPDPEYLERILVPARDHAFPIGTSSVWRPNAIPGDGRVVKSAGPSNEPTHIRVDLGVRELSVQSPRGRARARAEPQRVIPHRLPQSAKRL